MSHFKDTVFFLCYLNRKPSEAAEQQSITFSHHAALWHHSGPPETILSVTAENNRSAAFRSCLQPCNGSNMRAVMLSAETAVFHNISLLSIVHVADN